jgi:hypothetical protein
MRALFDTMFMTLVDFLQYESPGLSERICY